MPRACSKELSAMCLSDLTQCYVSRPARACRCQLRSFDLFTPDLTFFAPDLMWLRLSLTLPNARGGNCDGVVSHSLGAGGPGALSLVLSRCYHVLQRMLSTIITCITGSMITSLAGRGIRGHARCPKCANEVHFKRI